MARATPHGWTSLSAPPQPRLVQRPSTAPRDQISRQSQLERRDAARSSARVVSVRAACTWPKPLCASFVPQRCKGKQAAYGAQLSVATAWLKAVAGAIAQERPLAPPVPQAAARQEAKTLRCAGRPQREGNRWRRKRRLDPGGQPEDPRGKPASGAASALSKGR